MVKSPEQQIISRKVQSLAQASASLGQNDCKGNNYLKKKKKLWLTHICTLPLVCHQMIAGDLKKQSLRFLGDESRKAKEEGN